MFPLETIQSLHGLVLAFVSERLETIADQGAEAAPVGDFETLDWLEKDTESRAEHVRWFLREANRLVRRHGIPPLDG